jgi:hypothetical protein
MPTPKQIDVTFDLNGHKHTYQVTDFNVLTNPVSVHVPVQRFLTDLLTCFDNCPGMTETALERINLHHGNLMAIVDPILVGLTMLAQTKIGMWKRNGASVEGQYFIYQHPR